jgi:phosphoglycolate phosphatase-like HAD superfamily hydrolase
VRTILSDLDGVLVDSHASIMRAWRWWVARNGLPAEAVEAIQHGRPSGEVIAALAPALDAAAESRAVDLRQAGDTEGRRRPARRPRAVRARRAARRGDVVHRPAGAGAVACRGPADLGHARHARAPAARQA